MMNCGAFVFCAQLPSSCHGDISGRKIGEKLNIEELNTASEASKYKEVILAEFIISLIAPQNYKKNTE